MRSSELLSKSWCELIFQGRNKDYGAYKLRSGQGRRYRFALLIVTVGAILATAVPTGLSLIIRYKIAREFHDVAEGVRELKRMEHNDEYTVKHVSAGRGMPQVTTVKGAADEKPEIVEVTKQDIVFGVNGPETFIVDDKIIFEDMDTLHNRDRIDLPTEGSQLIPVDVVKEMPQFPGGHKALMEWLDSNIRYPKSCIDQKIEGDMEVTFYIDIKGNVKDPHISKSLHPELDRATLRALRKMPRWVPGKYEDKLTAVCITLPIHFQIK
ncbi:MAG: energy transducer TonB [Bacteroidales bacterium]|nr:energy transducer TonB [Bacteroidales bacterium]